MSIFNFKEKIFPKKVPQTGLIVKAPSPSDYIAGASPVTASLEIRLDSGIWTPYRPTDEIQFKKFKFDTMSCASFSANNCVEYQINWMLANGKISDELKAWLNGNGYLEDGVCNLSDRFTAIMSGTTQQGNYFQAVWDSIRNNGVIPERVFPFDGNTFLEYHDATTITPEMKALGQEWRKRFEAVYEWVTYDNNPEFTNDQLLACKDNLRYAPLNIAIPVPGTHAITLEAIQDPTLTVFDQYPPFVNINQLDYKIHYALRGYVTNKEVAPIAPRVLRQGMVGEDVKKLQSDLIILGFYKNIADGNFGPITKAAVILFQKSKGLTADGIAGPITLKAIALAISLKKKISLKGIELIKQFEGFRSKPYQDAVNVWTIGYGSIRGFDGLPVTKKTKPVSKEEATALLMRDVEYFENKVNDLVKVVLTQNQYDALMSFIYNLGEGNLGKSTLLKTININPLNVVKKHFTDWNKAGGKVLLSLTRRREKEYLLFIS